jgi:SAM-dependent methyltransferase
MFLEIIAYIIISVLVLTYLFFFFQTAIVIRSIFSDVPFVPIKRKILREMDKALELKKEDKVLEIGSGDGRMLLYLSGKYPEINFTGFDIQPGLVWMANVKKRILGRENVEFFVGDALNFKDYGKYNKICLYMYSGFTGRFMEKYEKSFKEGTCLASAEFGFGKSFEGTHNIIKYPVKYINKEKYIYIWKK